MNSIQPCHPLIKVHIAEKSKKILLSHILPIISPFKLSQTIPSPLFSKTVNSNVLNHMYPAINTHTYPLPLHTLNTQSQSKPTPTQSSLLHQQQTLLKTIFTHQPSFLATIMNICWYTFWFVCFLVHNT
jgi:hypothetical protein